jgi:hypothetical protein
MHQDLKHRLLAWKNDVNPGEIKKVFISDNPITRGEDIIRLEKSLSDTLSGKIETVTVSNKFSTTEHPFNDLDHLNSVISSLEKEFNDRYEKVMHETFKDKLLRFSQLN